jgi:N-hydroxyarylamine O-acetyltransferase
MHAQVHMHANDLKQLALGAETLQPELVERILAKLGFSQAPEADLDGLKAIYRAWSRKVPFDNILWRIYLASKSNGPVPGHNPQDFFENWLKYGTGGICFASGGAMYALLTALGFNATPVLCWMPDVMHTGVVVECEGTPYFVDQSVPHSEPLSLGAEAQTQITSPGWGMRLFSERGRWHFRWKTFSLPGIEEMGCLFAPRQYTHPNVAATLAQNYEIYNRLRGHSEYDCHLNAWLLRAATFMWLLKGDVLIRVEDGRREVAIDIEGDVIQRVLNPNELRTVIIDAFGISEELARRLPPELSLDRRSGLPDRRQAADPMQPSRRKATADRRQPTADP